MTTLLERIKNERMAAMRAKDALRLGILNPLLGDIENADRLNEKAKLGKYKTADINAIAEQIVKSYVKNNTGPARYNPETGAAIPLTGEQVATLDAEKALLEGFLPKQLSATDLTEILTTNYLGKFVDEKSKGAIMGFLKANYANQYDGKVAAQVVDAFIAARLAPKTGLEAKA